MREREIEFSGHRGQSWPTFASWDQPDKTGVYLAKWVAPNMRTPAPFVQTLVLHLVLNLQNIRKPISMELV